MHFLTVLVKNPVLENPFENYPEIHRHFTRYSKGQFTGPVIKAKFTTNKITLYGSFEYEDFIQEYLTSVMPDGEFPVSSVIFASRDLKEDLYKLGLDWKLAKSKGDTKNYKGTFEDTFTKKKLNEVIKTLNKRSYYFSNFKLEGYSVKCKKKPPQPSKKPPTDDEIQKLTNFCVANAKNSQANKERLFKELIPDFLEELPEKSKSFTLINEYKFDNIILPKNVKNSILMRLRAIREGKLVRTLRIGDEEEFTNSFKISVWFPNN